MYGPSTTDQTSRRVSSSRSTSTSRTVAPVKNVTIRSRPSRRVSTTNPGTSRRCGAPQSRSAAHTSSGWALIVISLEPVGKGVHAGAGGGGAERGWPQRGLGCGWSGLIRASRLVMIMTVAQYTIASWCSGRRS